LSMFAYVFKIVVSMIASALNLKIVFEWENEIVPNWSSSMYPIVCVRVSEDIIVNRGLSYNYNQS
jgi:hypothetical protein